MSAQERRIFYSITTSFLLALAACSSSQEPPPQSSVIARPPSGEAISTDKLPTPPIPSATLTPPDTPTPETKPSPTPQPTINPTERPTPLPQKLDLTDIPEVATAIAERSFPTPRGIIYQAPARAEQSPTGTSEAKKQSTPAATSTQTMEQALALGIRNGGDPDQIARANALTATPVVLAHAAEQGRNIDTVQSVESGKAAVRWSHEIFLSTDPPPQGYIFIDLDQNIFALDPKGNPMRIDKSGKIIWDIEKTAMLIDVENRYGLDKTNYARVYVLDPSNNLLALDKTDGKEKWRVEVPKSPQRISWLLTKDYIIANYRTAKSDPEFYLVFDKESGQQIRRENGKSIYMSKGNTIVDGNRGYNAKTGELLYDLTQKEPGTKPNQFLALPYNPLNALLLERDPSPGVKPLIALFDIETGRQTFRVERTESGGNYSFKEGFNNRLYLGHYQNPDSAKIIALNKNTQREDWSYSIPDSNISTREADNVLYVSIPNIRKTIALNNSTGREIWQTTSLQPNELRGVSGPWIFDNGIGILGFWNNSGTKGNPQLLPEFKGFDPKTGKEKWKYKAKAEVRNYFGIEQEIVMIEGDKLAILRTDGTLIANPMQAQVLDINYMDRGLLVQTGEKGKPGKLTAISIS